MKPKIGDHNKLIVQSHWLILQWKNDQYNYTTIDTFPNSNVGLQKAMNLIEKRKKNLIIGDSHRIIHDVQSWYLVHEEGAD